MFIVCMRIITLKKYKLFLLYSKNKLKDLKQKLPSNIYSMIHQGFPFFVK